MWAVTRNYEFCYYSLIKFWSSIYSSEKLLNESCMVKVETPKGGICKSWTRPKQQCCNGNL